MLKKSGNTKRSRGRIFGGYLSQPTLQIGANIAHQRRRFSLGTSLILVFAGFLFLIFVHVGVQAALKNLLTEQGRMTGIDWAHHIEQRMPQISRPDARRPDTGPLEPEQAREFVEMVNGMLSVGNIFQVDLINEDCYCDVTIGTFASKKAQLGDQGTIIHSHNDHEHNQSGHSGNFVISKDPPSKSVLQHVIGDTSSHERYGAELGRFPLDREELLEVVKEKADRIHLHHGDGISQPRTFAEVIHPVTTNGKVVYLLRIMIDLAEPAARLTKTLYMVAAVAIVLLVLAFLYPAISFLRTSEQRRNADLRAHVLARTDLMTGVSNRNAFQEHVPEILRRCKEDKKDALALLIDIDKFKPINDYHGHEVGDKVICALAEELTRAMPENALLARLGGDEFSIIVSNVAEEQQVDQLLRLPTELNVTISEGRQSLDFNVSIGMSRFPRDGDDIDTLMRNADFALYDSKSVNGGKLTEYSEEMSAAALRRLRLFDDLKEALDNDEFQPYYQPLVNLKTSRIEGFEALARWVHPTKGPIPASSFEEIFTDRRLGARLGEVMRSKVLADMKRWNEIGVDYQSVGINVGEPDLLEPGFALKLISQLARYKINPSDLAIEITEMCMFGDNKDAFIHHLEVLRKAGCFIALDDFGTGFSSITQIKQLPRTALKIDKSFIDNVVDDVVDQSIIRSLLELGAELGFKLVLEGVESAEQAELLRSLGCTIAQGYYYSPPVAAAEVPEMINRFATPAPAAIIGKELQKFQQLSLHS